MYILKYHSKLITYLISFQTSFKLNAKFVLSPKIYCERKETLIILTLLKKIKVIANFKLKSTNYQFTLVSLKKLLLC